MKIFLIAGLLLYSFNSIAQGVQKPKKNYEYQDTRKKNESFAKLPADLKAELSTFTFSGIDEGIKRELLTKIPYTSFGPDFMSFEASDIKATITTAPFDAAKHKLDYDEGYLIKIDRKPYYGGYSMVPKKYISNLTIIMGKDTVAIPPAAYVDLYNLNFAYSDKGTQRTTNGIYRSANPHRIYLYLFCKDNTGSYEVTWIIYDKKYVRRVLDYGFM
ncbi:MAG: hypothetical protein JWO92_1979 [Chitinophagaceae bacterium]|nr:hypothetical protein [Chitinophagaceae bacterium]